MKKYRNFEVFIVIVGGNVWLLYGIGIENMIVNSM